MTCYLILKQSSSIIGADMKHYTEHLPWWWTRQVCQKRWNEKEEIEEGRDVAQKTRHIFHILQISILPLFPSPYYLFHLGPIHQLKIWNSMVIIIIKHKNSIIYQQTIEYLLNTFKDIMVYKYYETIWNILISDMMWCDVRNILILKYKNKFLIFAAFPYNRCECWLGFDSWPWQQIFRNFSVQKN